MNTESRARELEIEEVRRLANDASHGIDHLSRNDLDGIATYLHRYASLLSDATEAQGYVPREPTEAMLKVAEERNPPFGAPEALTEEYCAKWRARHRRAAAELWKAMYDAAPSRDVAGDKPDVLPEEIHWLSQVDPQHRWRYEQKQQYDSQSGFYLKHRHASEPVRDTTNKESV